MEGADNLISSQTSVGPAKVRRRSSSAVEPLSGSMNMTTAQLLTFRAFVKETIKDGALPFAFPDPVGGPALLVRRKAHAISAFGVDWRVNLTLEVLP